jgi:hypothetical protein
VATSERSHSYSLYEGTVLDFSQAVLQNQIADQITMKFRAAQNVRERLLAKLKQVKAALRVRMHQPLAEVGRWLKSVVQGYFNYHGVRGNLASLPSFRLEVRKRWLHVIRRRSQRSRMTWELLERFAAQWLPIPKILHPYPLMRFDADHPKVVPCLRVFGFDREPLMVLCDSRVHVTLCL